MTPIERALAEAAAAAARGEVPVGAVVTDAAGTLFEDMGQRPMITVRMGDATKEIRNYMASCPDLAMLVLGAAATGAPGPLITHFAGADAGALPGPVTIVPGGLSDEEIDRMS